MKQQGFTLIELVMVIVVSSIAAVGLISQFSFATISLLNDEIIQTATQLTQEGSETVLTLRRTQNFAAVATGTSVEALTGNYAAYTRTTTVNQPPTGSGCAAGATCKEVIVTVDHNGTNAAQATFLLVDY